MASIKDQDALKNLIRIVSQGKATKEQAKVLKEVMSASDNKKMDVFLKARDQGRLALDYDGVPAALPKKRKATASVKEAPVDVPAEKPSIVEAAPVKETPVEAAAVEEPKRSRGKATKAATPTPDVEVKPTLASPEMKGKTQQELLDIINKPLTSTPEAPQAAAPVAKPDVEVPVEEPAVAETKPKASRKPRAAKPSIVTKAVEEAVEKAPKTTSAVQELAKDTPESAAEQVKAMRERMAAAEPSAPAAPVKRTSMDPSFKYQMTPEAQLYKTGETAPKPPVRTSSSAKYNIDPTGKLVAADESIFGPKTSEFVQEAVEEGKAPKAIGGATSLGEPTVTAGKSTSFVKDASGIDLTPTALPEGPMARSPVPVTGRVYDNALLRKVTSTVPEVAEAAASNPSLLKQGLRGVAKGAPHVATVFDAYDVGKNIVNEDYEGAARSAASAAGGAAGGWAGAKLGALGGAPFGPPGVLVGATLGGIGGGFGGSYLAGKGADKLKERYGEEPKEEPKSPTELLEGLIKTAKTDKERSDLAQVLARTRVSLRGGSEEEQLAAGEQERTRLDYTRPKSAEEADKRIKNEDDMYADFISNAESNNNYRAVNKNSGAFGKYQILEKDEKGKDVHGKAIEKRYGMPFKEAMSDPAKQEDYFRNVLLPRYKKVASELAKTPEAKERGLDEFTLVGMLQLGEGHVRNFLRDNVNNNIADQMYYFQGRADQYKRLHGLEKADVGALKAKEEEWQERGSYIPYKSAQAKMDTLRSSEIKSTREDQARYNAASDMAQDQLLKRLSPAQRRIQETETLTSDSFTPEQIGMVAASPETGKVEAVPPSTAAKVVSPTQRSRLEEALELQRQYEMLAGISRGSERLGRGLAAAISGVAPSKMSEGEFEEGLTRMGKQGVEGAKLLEEEAIKKEENDPMSEKSIRARESLSSILGKPIPESMSYSDIKSLKLSDITLKTSAAESKLGSASQKRLSDFSKKIDPSLGRTGEFGEQYKIVNRANRLEALASKTENLTGPQMEELAIGTAKILSGTGSGSRSQVEALVPRTIRGDFNKIVEWVANNPTGLDQQKFVKITIDLLKREKALAQKSIADTIKQRAVEFKKELNSEDEETNQSFNDVYNTALKTYAGIDQQQLEEPKAMKLGQVINTSPEQRELLKKKKLQPGKTFTLKSTGKTYVIGDDFKTATEVIDE